jgi:ComF family protein
MEVHRITAAELQSHPAFLFHHLMWTAIDWIFPPVCGGCDRPGLRWCLKCQQQTTILKDAVCQSCGCPLPKAGICQECQSIPPLYRALRSWGRYSGPLRNAIHRLKYKNDMSLGEALGHHLIQVYEQTQWQADLIVPVPLSSQRLRERGYNQASLLARPVALYFKIPFSTRALKRVRHTEAQVGLKASDRIQNVHNAFEANPTFVANKTILVVDDVATTGSTLHECTRALLDAGAKNVYGLTLARATFSDEIPSQVSPISEENQS